MCLCFRIVRKFYQQLISTFSFTTLASFSPIPIAPCTNITDAFRDGVYAKSFCLVDTNLNYDTAAENCARQGMSIYNPMPIEDPLFFFTNGNQDAYIGTEQIFIAKTDENYPEFNLYCMGYIFFRELYQKSSVECEKLSYSFCEFQKLESKLTFIKLVCLFGINFLKTFSPK